MTQPSLFDRISSLERLIFACRAATTARRKLAKEVMDADDAATARAIMGALSDALDVEQAALAALPLPPDEKAKGQTQFTHDAADLTETLDRIRRTDGKHADAVVLVWERAQELTAYLDALPLPPNETPVKPESAATYEYPAATLKTCDDYLPRNATARVEASAEDRPTPTAASSAAPSSSAITPSAPTPVGPPTASVEEASEEKYPTAASGATGRPDTGDSSVPTPAVTPNSTAATTEAEEASEGSDFPSAGGAAASAKPGTTTAPLPATRPTSTAEEASEGADPSHAGAAAELPVVASFAGPTTFATQTAPAMPSTTEYDGPPPAFWSGEDLDTLGGITTLDVANAYCASAVMGAKSGKPGIIAPFLVEKALYVSTADVSQWQWRTAVLWPVVPLETWRSLNPGREPSATRVGASYDGVLVQVKGKRGVRFDHVISGPERRIRWLDPNSPRPPADWSPRPAPRVCSGCGITDEQRTFTTGDRCAGCWAAETYPPEPLPQEGVQPTPGTQRTAEAEEGRLFPEDAPTAHGGGL